MNSVADVWDNVLSQLKGELSETTIATWFDELEAVDIQGNTFILHCSNDFKKGYIESLFMKNIKASLHDIFSTDFEVKILDDLDYAELKDNRPHRQSERFTSAEFTFETFVVGPSNKLAYAASVSVAEHPAQNYNPLLIYGDSGLGKTHLIYAIANVIRRNDPTVQDRLRQGRRPDQRAGGCHPGGQDRGDAGEVPSGGPAAGGRRAVHRRQEADAGGVLPYLQHPVRVRPADRPDLRPSPL